MSSTFLEELQRNGPDGMQSMSPDEARAWCRRLARQHYENFSVLSSLVPEHARNDFASIYAFCRWSDDLSDEAGSPERSKALLDWWRGELHDCFGGSVRHPVFVALRQTIERCELPIEPFEQLIDAFQRDQVQHRYDTWEDLLSYCRGSADPVGRLVLMVLGEPRDDAHFIPSDRICTALQLTNHWQDVRRDVLERDRIYLPQTMHFIHDFEDRLRKSAMQGWAVDRTFLQPYRELIQRCVDRTWKLYEEGAVLIDRLQPAHRPVIWLFLAGGMHILRSIEMWNYETALHRPRLGRLTKASLVARAWWRFRRAGVHDGSRPIS